MSKSMSHSKIKVPYLNCCVLPTQQLVVHGFQGIHYYQRVSFINSFWKLWCSVSFIELSCNVSFIKLSWDWYPLSTCLALYPLSTWGVTFIHMSFYYEDVSFINLSCDESVKLSCDDVSLYQLVMLGILYHFCSVTYPLSTVILCILYQCCSLCYLTSCIILLKALYDA